MFPNRYPSLNEFWPPIRARNFVKKLCRTPGNYAHNMEILAAKAGVHPKQMWYVNPVTFAEREFKSYRDHNSDALIKLLGRDTYYYFCQERDSGCFSSRWAYHKGQSIPEYNPWAWQVEVMQRLLARIVATPHGAERVPVIGELFSYLLRNEPFLRASSKMCDVTAQKVAEFKADPLTEPIRDTLEAVEAMMARIRPPAPAPVIRVGDHVRLTPEANERLGVTEDRHGLVNMVTCLPPKARYLASDIELVPAPEAPQLRIGDYVQLSPAGREKSMQTTSFMAIRGLELGRITDARGEFTVTRNKRSSNYSREELEPARDVAQAMLEAASFNWSVPAEPEPAIQDGSAVRLNAEAKERYGVPLQSDDFGTACPFPIGSYVELSEKGRQKPSHDRGALGSYAKKRTARVMDMYPSDRGGYVVIVSHDGDLHSEYHEEDLMAVDQVAYLTEHIRWLEERIADLESPKRT